MFATLTDPPCKSEPEACTEIPAGVQIVMRLACECDKGIYYLEGWHIVAAVGMGDAVGADIRRAANAIGCPCSADVAGAFENDDAERSPGENASKLDEKPVAGPSRCPCRPCPLSR